jgi:dsRNA-specific ribonuclease
VVGIAWFNDGARCIHDYARQIFTRKPKIHKKQLKTIKKTTKLQHICKINDKGLPIYIT